MRCFYDEGYYLALPEGHPFPMEKFPDARKLLGDSVTVAPPLRLSRRDLARAHDPAYLDRVSRDAGAGGAGGLLPYDRNRLGLPADPGLLERSALETAGTVSAALAALEDGLAANLAGGTHHAFPARGLGFCVLNDVAVAVEYLRAHTVPTDSILIVDTDAHQGNANHAYFADNPAVTTYSIHVGKNYPARKEPGDIDVPLPRYVEGPAYLGALRATLPRVFADTEPDLVFWISGADPHRDDRFGQMRLTTAEMEGRDAFVLDLCREFAAPTAILYGGGYNREPRKTAALHAQTIRLAAQRAAAPAAT